VPRRTNQQKERAMAPSLRSNRNRIAVGRVGVSARAFCGIALGLALAAGPVAASAQDRDPDRLLAPIFAPWTSDRTPGCAVGFKWDGQPAVLRAYGMADLGHAIPNTPTTRFEVGSVSKQFVAASILMLVEEGKLALDDDIRRYLPELPDYGTPITIDHLLYHTSGLRDWSYVMEIAGWPRSTRAYTNADVLAITARQRELNFTPGTDYSYSNTNYNLLAIIVERVSGMSLAQFTHDRIFAPLGMNATDWRTDFRQVEPNLATAYIDTSRGNVIKMPMESVYGDAGLITTVGDLLIWNDALTAHRFGPFVARAMEENGHLADGRPLPRARGLVVALSAPIPQIVHAGAVGGYRAWLARYPTRHFSLAVLCNAGEEIGAGRGSMLGHAVASAFLGSEPPAPAAAPDPDAARHTGLFVSDKTGWPLIFVERDHALALDTGAPVQRRSADQYALGDSTLRFDGADLLRRENSDGTIEVYRRRPLVTHPEGIAALIGRYASDEAGAAYRVEERPGGGIRLRLVERPDFVIDPQPFYRDAWMYDTRMGARGGIIRFVRDAQGTVTGLTIGWSERVRAVLFRRVPE
jgi:CubicO group peptidase (beta-lactamase class C family)